MKKIIATGKGGVGKTTTLSALSQLYAKQGKRVIVFDTDPSMNLALTFGIPFDGISTITEDRAHISHDIEENGIGENGLHILEEHSAVTDDGIRIVIMGAILHGGDGCLCSAISMIKILLNYVEEQGEYDIAIVDSQAGPEVLGRGLASQFDVNLILTEPTAKSSEVSRQVKQLGEDLGVKDTILIVNKIDFPGDVSMTASMVGVPPFKSAGVRYDRCVIEADRDGDLLIDKHPDSKAVQDIKVAKGLIDRSLGLE